MARGRHYGQGSKPPHIIDETVRKTALAKAELEAATPKPKDLKVFVPQDLSKRRQAFVDIRAP